MATDTQSAGTGRPRSRRPWSLATRLALSYAVSAFLLVAAATGLHYRTLVASLAAEDDQMLRERLTEAMDGALADARAGAPSVRSPRRERELAVRLLDRACRPLPGSPAPESSLPPPRCPAGDALPGVTLRTIVIGAGTEWRIATAPLPSSPVPAAWMEVLLDRTSDQQVLARFRLDGAAVLLAALLAAAALGYGLARRGLRPLDGLRDRVARIDAHSLALRLDARDAPSEIAALTASFDAMLERLHGAFESLTTRSAELAHELRTPLHVMRQQAEVALGRARTPEEYREVLSSSLEELDRLQRLADDMLFLARTADPRAAIRREPLVLAKELADIASYLEALAEERGVRLESHAPADLSMAADRGLVQRALVNLVTNALRHTPAGGRVTMRADRAGVRGGVAVIVTDTGSGVAAELLPRIFEPYARGDGGGAGLGLAIVRGIVGLHGGTAVLESVPGRGTSVTLTFFPV